MSEENTIAEKIVRNRITLLNFICIIFVVVWHAENLEVYHIESAATGFAGFVNWAEHYWYAIGRVVAMQTFFFISGFLFYRSFSADKILDKYKSRLRTLVIPYLCWCTTYYLLFVLIGKIPFLSSMVNFRPRELSLSAWIASLWTNQYYTLWFMKHLIVFVLLCPLFYLVFKNRRGLPTGTAALILLLSYCYFGWGPNPAGMAAYCAGCWFALNHKDLIMTKNSLLTWFGLLFLIAMLITSASGFNCFTELFVLAALWFAMDKLDLSGNLPWWMSITFFIYCSHDIILEAIEKIVLMVFGRSPLMALIDFFVSPLITIVIVIAIAWIMRKYTPKLWGVLTGNR